MDTSRYIPNTFPEPLDLPDSAASLLQHALTRIVRAVPPQTTYAAHAAHKLGGIAGGPTALTYLFLRLADTDPSLSIAGHPPRHWAEAYARPNRGLSSRHTANCGITSETLSLLAMKACLSKRTADVEAFIEGLVPILSPSSAASYPSELLYGRAGTLYLIRALRHFVPHAGLLLDEHIATLNRRIMDVGEDGRGNWRFHGKRYLGAAHGDIGIITQLVLTTPSLAPALQPRLEALLDAQLESGNFPSSDGSTSDRLVQWCHGAPGYVMSLLALREFFPGLEARIDGAVERGRACIWERGLLHKEPCLCHGILGNAL